MIEVIEYVTDDAAVMFTDAVSLTVPAAAVSVEVCAGVDVVVVTEKVLVELVQPTVTVAGAVIPVPVLLI